MERRKGGGVASTPFRRLLGATVKPCRTAAIHRLLPSNLEKPTRAVVKKWQAVLVNSSIRLCQEAEAHVCDEEAGPRPPSAPEAGEGGDGPALENNRFRT